MRHSIYIIVISLMIGSCKKDKLEGDKAIFIGKWNWTFTSHSYGICEGYNFSEVLTPESEEETFSLEFFEKGIVKFFQNKEIIKTYRVVFSNFGENCSGDYSEYKGFDIHLNNKDDDSFYVYGCVDFDEIVFVKGFPFMVVDEGCEIYTSHFIKE